MDADAARAAYQKLPRLPELMQHLTILARSLFFRQLCSKAAAAAAAAAAGAASPQVCSRLLEDCKPVVLIAVCLPLLSSQHMPAPCTGMSVHVYMRPPVAELCMGRQNPVCRRLQILCWQLPWHIYAAEIRTGVCAPCLNADFCM